MTTGPVCHYCQTPLTRCPRGDSCPGSRPGLDWPCLECQWGMVCPVHGHRWPAGHQPARTRLRHTSVDIVA